MKDLDDYWFMAEKVISAKKIAETGRIIRKHKRLIRMGHKAVLGAYYAYTSKKLGIRRAEKHLSEEICKLNKLSHTCREKIKGINSMLNLATEDKIIILKKMIDDKEFNKWLAEEEKINKIKIVPKKKSKNKGGKKWKIQKQTQ